ncbi:pyridoxal phosphate-dependent aminotransferase [Rarobacter faecitabidus]|uniref:Aminotransferase n=1 Tax=Rarobacter faecitabidus TaxID=13243 RepID=A0A542ZB07_RARFA|nr:aminotransferase class I/II-fold pyridoxal phosphate-dependent enzyme [Rarobacter faecitabidus]TQL57525.1 aspartate/methionine/tyrosine aminotransferase [Rarobacter faecitabidus]
MKVSARSEVPAFAVMDILAAAKARKAAGQDVISLCVGEPVSGASEVVRRRAIELLEAGDLGYTEPFGAPVLRNEIARHYERWYGSSVDPARIAVTTGSSGAFMIAFLAAFDPGDVVALARPGYPAYSNILTALDCEVLGIECGPEQDYRIGPGELDAALARRGRLDGLVLASPANPTGTMMTAEELDAVAAWCAAHDVRLISDEIYHGIVYDTARWPGASAIDHVGSGAVVVNSFSKYWAMTGWRLGWMVLPADLLGGAEVLTGNVALCPPSLAQFAAVAAFSDEGYAAAQRDVEQYARTREVLLAALPELGWREVAPPDGAFYVYADIGDFGLPAAEYCARLLAEAGVALAPGTDFDVVAGDRWVRLSLAAGERNIVAAIPRIATWQATLG